MSTVNEAKTRRGLIDHSLLKVGVGNQHLLSVDMEIPVDGGRPEAGANLLKRFERVVLAGSIYRGKITRRLRS